MNQTISSPNPKRYFTMIPNMADESDMDSFEFRLYFHYNKVGGNCTESTKTTAKKCKMGAGTVSKKRQSLAEKGWIELEDPNPDDPFDTVKVRVIDRWAENMLLYSPNERGRSPDESPPSSNESPPSPDEPKKNKNKITITLKTIKEVPEILRTPEFEETFNAWVAYRAERKPKVTPTSAQRIVKQMGRFAESLGTEWTIKRLEAGMANGWQGLIFSKDYALLEQAQSGDDLKSKMGKGGLK